jgi:hypothetical protein
VFRFSSAALRHRVQNARSRTGCCATSPHTSAVLEKLAREKPEVLACMHGSAWRGDGAALLRELSKTLVDKAMALPLAA